MDFAHVELLLAAVAFAGFLFFAWRRSLTYLHIFQQEEYDGPRFVRWLINSGAFDRRLSVVLLITGIAQRSLPAEAVWPFPLLAAALMVAVAWREADPRTASKKKLVVTARAKRILAGAAILDVVAAAICAANGAPVLGWILVVQTVPFALVLSNLALSPVEAAGQKRYWNEAHDKLTRLAPKVIGVTGSFGKTSVKHILGHILETAAPSLITPGSVNTPMGISRIVRERLEPRHRYFVVEMGAYGPGSIERLCRLAPPDMGVITAIGMAHYERFKTLDTVAHTKFELAEAVTARGGKVVVAEQVLGFAPSRAFADAHAASMVVCGSSGSALTVGAVRQEASGLVVEVTWQGKPYTLKAPIYGAHHGGNMAVAFAAACTLGLDPEMVATALRSTPQIPHRLEVKRQSDGTIIIDDAYNSNPVGFASALDLLPLLRTGDGRRILVTPGMVELGAAHDDEHARLGGLAAGRVDILLAVQPQRIPTFVGAYSQGAPNGTVITCQSFAEASAWMGANLRPGDAVLLENDLPDLYERKLSL